MYAARDPEFYRAYADAILGAKPGAEASALALNLSNAFNSVYRLVAFDIDGTLTPASSPKIDPHVADLIASLLRRGVEVLLVTGRGRDATRVAAREIAESAQGPRRLFQRLSAVTSNGMYLLETGPDEPLLERETPLHGGFDLEAIGRPAVDVLKAADISHSVRFHGGAEQGMGSLRVDLRTSGEQSHAREELIEALEGTGIEISTGRYGDVYTLDLTSTNKAAAIAAVAKLRGIDDTMILRVGDRGAEGENDWAMLDSAAGFSVGSCSASPDGCWPVLDDELNGVTGLDATAALLDGVLLFAPLSIAPEDPAPVLRDLLRVERAAQRRSRLYSSEMTKRLQMRARSFVPEDEQADAQLSLIEIADIFDPQSGAVRLRDWELYDVPDGTAALFDMPTHEVPPPETERTATWSMWSDTGLLLRGPEYYRGLVHKKQQFRAFVDAHNAFLSAAQDELSALAREPFTILRWKLALGILDQARNAALATLLATFHAEHDEGAAAAQATLVRLVRIHTAFLLGTNEPWADAVYQANEVVSEVRSLACSCESAVMDQQLYSYRECDFFLENLVAIEAAVREMRRSGGWEGGSTVLAVGLASGGAEFPAIVTAVANRTGAEVDGALLKLSTYGEGKLSHDEQLRRGDADYVRSLLDDPGRFMRLGAVGEQAARQPVVLCDDNVTTAVSLQHARDVMLLRGHPVIGAAVVRYPGANRAVHMNLPGHGFPDPAALAGFIRGLVAAAPYTRLLVPNSESGANPYRDRRGRFNKAKERVERLLGIDQQPGAAASANVKRASQEASR